MAARAVAFRVSCACEMCKDGIETTEKIRGVKKAVWDIDSKILSLIYNPSLAPLEKIKNRIVAVGHDLEDKKTKDVVYNALPKSCHYREMETMMDEIKKDTVPAQVKNIRVTVDSALRNEPLAVILHLHIW